MHYDLIHRIDILHGGTASVQKSAEVCCAYDKSQNRLLRWMEGDSGIVAADEAAKGTLRIKHSIVDCQFFKAICRFLGNVKM